MGLSATTICMVVQLGLAMMPLGQMRASSLLISGTTSGMSTSIRKALELSIIMAPYLVMSLAYSFDMDAPAEVNAISMPSKSSLCLSSCTVYSFPQKVYLRPAERVEPNSLSSSMGNFLSAKILRNSCPTAPDAPTIATFMFVLCFNVFITLQSYY